MPKLSTDEARELAAQRQEVERTCPVCGTVFEALGRGVYCSDPCKGKAAYERHREKRKASFRAAYARKKLASAPTETTA